jgi:hypothetical protein
MDDTSKELVKTAAEALRALAAENKELRQKIASYDENARAEKLLDRLEARGLQVEGDDRKEKVAFLMNHHGGLDAFEAMASIAVPNGVNFTLDNDSRTGSADARTTFENMILNG